MAKQTKEAILNAAADLFGQHGFDNVSVRDITNKAGVNLSALSYHFTDKNGLVDEVINTQVDKLNTNRLNLLAKAKIDYKDAPPVRTILEAFIAPVYLPEIHQTHPSIIGALTARTMVHQSENNPYNQELFKKTVEDFVGAFQTVHPKLGEESIRQLMKLSAGAAITFRTFAYSPEGMEDLKATQVTYTEDFATLLDYCEAGFNAIASKVS